MLDELIEFKREHGHTNVPQRSGKYRELAHWIRNQRAAKRYNRPIIAERGKRLDEIGFCLAANRSPFLGIDVRELGRIQKGLRPLQRSAALAREQTFRKVGQHTANSLQARETVT